MLYSTRIRSLAGPLRVWSCVLLAAFVWLGSPRDGHAQATSWLYAGGGGSVVERSQTETLSLVQVDAGLGTSALSPIVWGGVFRAQGFVGSGLDLGVLSRFVSSGFARGDFGGGIDVGVMQRLWGQKSTGFCFNALLGAPWGLTLSVGGTLGNGNERAWFGSLGIDLARLTVHRHSGLNWMPNPMRSPVAEEP